MNPGDWVTIHMHDTPAGLRIDLVDETTHQSGSMTASLANGFAHVLYTPNASTCKSAPYAFHPEYSTANPRGNTWSAHTYNVAYSDEIGHFEHCNALDANFNCAVAGSDDPTLDDDDTSSAFRARIHSRPHQRLLRRRSRLRRAFVPERLAGHQPEPDRRPAAAPRAAAVHEPDHRQRARLLDDRLRGRLPRHRTELRPEHWSGLREPAAGIRVLPVLLHANVGRQVGEPLPRLHGGCLDRLVDEFRDGQEGQRRGSCIWQEGGNFIPGTVRNFGGSAEAEFGPILQTVFPATGFTTVLRFENFNSGDMPNPCTSNNR